MQSYMNDFDYQTVFIAGNIDEVPVRKECIDVYIDDFSSTNCIFTYNHSHYRHIAPLLKKRGVSAGIFTDYEKAPMSLENFKNDHPTFIPEKMKLGNIKNDISSSGMKFTESKLIGSTSGKEKQFNRQVGNERVPVMGFIAAKE